MAFTMEELKGLPAQLGDFLSSNAAPVVLGKAAQAFTAKDPNSWQYQLGGVGADMGQSKIAATAAKNQATERQKLSQLLTQALSGNLNFTPKGEYGPTAINFKAGGNDTSDKLVLEGDGLLGDGRKDNLYQSEKNLRGAPGQPSAAPPKSAGNVQPAAPPQQQSLASVLPLFLAQAATGSGGGSTDLFGLSPEQIQGISRTDIAGQEILGRGTGDIFQNMVRQAQRDYYNRLPQAHKPAKPQLPSFQLKKGASGNFVYFDNMGQVRDTGVPYQPGLENMKTVDLGDSIGVITPDGKLQKIPKGLNPQQSREADYQNRLMESGVKPEESNMGAIMAAGGDPDVITGGRIWADKHAQQIAENRRLLLKDGKEHNTFEAAQQNKQAPLDSKTFVHWNVATWGNSWKEIPLPKVDGKQMTMADAKAEAQRQKVTLEEFLDNVYEHLKARGEL